MKSPRKQSWVETEERGVGTSHARGEVARLFAFGVTRWRTAWPLEFPKLKKKKIKADGFKGPLIPNKKSRCGL